jgi:hypothetical protein
MAFHAKQLHGYLTLAKDFLNNIFRYVNVRWETPSEKTKQKTNLKLHEMHHQVDVILISRQMKVFSEQMLGLLRTL